MTNDSKTNPATAEQSDATKEIIAKGHAITKKAPADAAFVEDKRETARHEHTNHFTNRASSGSK